MTKATIIKLAWAVLNLLSDPELMDERECPAVETVPCEFAEKGLSEEPPVACWRSKAATPEASWNTMV